MQTLYSFSSLLLSFPGLTISFSEGVGGSCFKLSLISGSFDHETFTQKKLKYILGIMMEKYILGIMMEHYFTDFISLSSKV